MKYIGILVLIIVSAFFFFHLSNLKRKMSVLRLNMKTEPKTMDPRKGVDRYSYKCIFIF